MGAAQVEAFFNDLATRQKLSASTQNQALAALREGYGGVELPDAIARKYPAAAQDWLWQYVFPAAQPTVDPRLVSLSRDVDGSPGQAP